MIDCPICGSKKSKRYKTCSKSCGLVLRFRNPSESAKQSERVKKFMNSPAADELKAKVAATNRTPERRLQQSEMWSKIWADPVRRKELEEKRNSPEYVSNLSNKVSEGLVRFWSIPENKDRQLSYIRSSANTRPNGLETYFLDLIKDMFPKFKYVGDGSFIIAGKNPDFVDYDNKLIIELFGDYWHRGEDPQDKISLFSRHSYRALVLWESEVYKSGVLDKVSSFVSENSFKDAPWASKQPLELF